MITLGIDPGLRRTGYCIISKQSQSLHIIDHGCLKLSSSKSIPERIEQFYLFFNQKITEQHVIQLIIETPFLGKNAQNFLKLGYLRGILYLLSRQKQINIVEYSPPEIKQAVTGYGGASKDQILRILFQLFPRLQTPESLDVSDAIAIALCGIWRTSPAQQRLQSI